MAIIYSRCSNSLTETMTTESKTTFTTAESISTSFPSYERQDAAATTDKQEVKNDQSVPIKDLKFWLKIICTQFLIRHPFWKSFSLPIILGQLSTHSKTDYSDTRHLYFVYGIIAFHFLSGILISDRKFRHALGFLPHIFGLLLSAYLLSTDVFQKLNPWIRIRTVTHALGTMSTICFISSLHTSSARFRSILRYLSLYLNVFYLVLNSYIYWWSNDEIRLYGIPLYGFLIRIHAIIWLIVSAGFCLDIYILRACQVSLYLTILNLFIDMHMRFWTNIVQINFWIQFDSIIDDLVILCGYFYLYQFYINKQPKTKPKAE
ncbi:unnamed protein product [Didymodactylos carnosus]|uniref:Uncharacterized protein n=1 Tax=Didymodactylos carnosus TaxID=1234261 RepID=A0A814HC19_9BILA|nr:unnamed protein product [Didymodactylos carnosus]CAF1157896.1 unnamed protein product [Didymodactylos carnosus]CAF3779895.1 unnamed protein product [Didymodactylos carnosus]CAF3969438.1 unnamed protein product [Didymodactylos carnosus]